MTAPTVSAFLRAVLPEHGIYVVARSDDGGLQKRDDGKSGMNQQAVGFVEDLVRISGECYNQPKDVWFALAAFRQGWHTVQTPAGEKQQLRVRTNVRAVRSLWLDIDAGSGKPYASRKEALAALLAFCKDAGMPCPWVVNSGRNGLHVYWTFTDEVEAGDWFWLASRLQAARAQHGLKADPMPTTDVVRILRLPGTWNMKGYIAGDHADLVEVRVAGEARSYAFYKTLLGKYEPLKPATSKPQPLALPTINPDTLPSYIGKIEAPANLMDWFQAAPEVYPEKDAEVVVAGCRQIRTMNDGREPEWRAALSVLRHCKGGREMAERLCTNPKWHTEYSIDEKFAWLEANDMPPMRCETFAKYRPEACAGCVFAGRINSPIAIPDAPLLREQYEKGKTQEKPVETTEVAAPADDMGEDTEAASEPEAPQIPSIQTKFSRVDTTGCFVFIPDRNGDKYWQQVYEYPVYPVQRVRGMNPKGELQLSYIFRKHRLGGWDDIEISGETLMGTGLGAHLGSVGFLLQEKERKWMAAMLIDLLKQTEPTLEETTVSDQLGWDEHHTHFLLGNRLYKTSGQVVEIAPKGKAARMSRLTVPRGELEVWKQIANVYNRKGLEWGQLTLAAAFASPLMSMGAAESAALMFLTGEMGAGKSAALSLGVSVFGDPSPRTGLMINKDDTYIARLAKLGIMNSIAAGFDEMTNLIPSEASELCYQITQGRGKDKMAQGGEMLQLNSTYWSCLPVMSANDSMIANLANHSKDASAQMSRVLEVKVTPISSLMQGEDFEASERLIRKLPKHYGMAGEMFIRYLTTHMEEVEERLYQMEKRVRQDTGMTAQYRFWTYMATRMMVGITIAKELGLVDYDLDRLYLYLTDLIAANHYNLGLHVVDQSTLLEQFLSEHEPNRLVVESTHRPPEMPDVPTKGYLNDVNYVRKMPNGREITVRYERLEQRAVISAKALRLWCKENGYVYSDFMRMLRKKYNAKEAKIELARETVARGNGTIACVVVNVPIPEETEREDLSIN